MAVNFTNSPSNGATITADGRTYTFSSSTGKWDVTASPGDTLLSLTDVGSDGTNGQVLTTNGSGSFTFTTPSPGGIASVVADTTPQLGGSLDVNGQSIVSVSNGNISIAPNGSGKVILDGLSWPTADGTANYVLKTDGSGNLSWTAQSSGGGGASVSTSDTAPSSPSDGDLWFDTTELTPYIYYADGSSNQWVEFANPDSGATPSLAIADLSDVNSTSPSSGQVLKWSGSEWAPAADNEGLSAGTLTATASGALANGDMVIVNSDGTVSAVAGSEVSAIAAALGSETVFNDSTANTGQQGASATFDSNSNKVVLAYRDAGNSNYGTAIVGTVSGNSISFGSEVVFNTRETSWPMITFDSNSNKIVIVYQDKHAETISGSAYSRDRATAIVGTVSGTSISFGSPTIMEPISDMTSDIGSSSFSNRGGITFDSYANKVVVCYVYKGAAYSSSTNTGFHAAVRVGTVSGTSISFGSRVLYNGTTGASLAGDIVFDSNSNKCVLVYMDGNNSDSSRSTKAIVGTVSGTSISFGSAVSVHSSGSTDIAGAFDSNSNKVVFAYFTASAVGRAIVGTVSGTSISFGTEVTGITTGAMYDTTVVFDSNANKIVIAYLDVANSWYGTLRECTVSGTSLTLGSAEVYNSGESDNNYGTTFDSNSNKVVLAYRDRGNSNRGTARVKQAARAASSSTNLTATNYIGIADAAYSNSATATIQVVGSVDDAQSGLTTGQAYYVQTDGSLSTTAGSPSVFAGTAVSASKLIIKG